MTGIDPQTWGWVKLVGGLVALWWALHSCTFCAKHMADESDSFGLGRICERIARSRKIHCNRIEFFTAANKLAAMGTYDLTKGTREIVSSTGIVSGGNGVSLTYAGVFYQYKPHRLDSIR